MDSDGHKIRSERGRGDTVVDEIFCSISIEVAGFDEDKGDDGAEENKDVSEDGEADGD